MGLTRENMHWRLPGSGLRKYALRENHIIPYDTHVSDPDHRRYVRTRRGGKGG